jgi:hypothetical protein
MNYTSEDAQLNQGFPDAVAVDAGLSNVRARPHYLFALSSSPHIIAPRTGNDRGTGMNVARATSASVSLILTAVVALAAFPAVARADESSGDLGLPLALSVEAGATRPFTLAEFEPQGRLSEKEPFIDFKHFEMGAYGGVVVFSNDFEADPALVGGLTARVPVPGIPLGSWGIFAQAFVSYVSRDLPFYYNDKSGVWYGLEVGGDYTFVRNETYYFRGQAGILYAYWNGVNALDNGVGLLLGAQLGFYWIKHNQNAVVTITPQFTYDGSNWMAIFSIGFSVDF